MLQQLSEVIDLDESKNYKSLYFGNMGFIFLFTV